MATEGALKPKSDGRQHVWGEEDDPSKFGVTVYEADSGCKAKLKAFFGRLQLGFVDTVELLPEEYKRLVVVGGKGGRSAQFLAWRSALLHTGTFFFAVIVGLDVYALVTAVDADSSESAILRKVNDRYDRYFESLMFYNRLQSAGLLAASAFAVALAAIASRFWRNFERSGPFVFASFLSSYLPPFLLLLFIPFRKGVDFQGIQMQMCQDMLNPSVFLNDSNHLPFMHPEARWPNLGNGELANILIDTYSIEFPSDFCSGDPKQWGSVLVSLLRDKGFLLEANGSCPHTTAISTGIGQLYANRSKSPAASTFSSVDSSSGSCPTACSNCTSSSCAPQLARLSALSSLYGPDLALAVSQDARMSSCAHCFASDLRCAWRCEDVIKSVTSQAVLGQLPSQAAACVSLQDTKDFELLMRLASQTAYWEGLLGTAYAMLSFSQIMPLALSLLFGAAKGSGIAKSVIPSSRLPGVISAASAIFTFPFATQLVIVIQSSVGNWITLCAILFLLFALLASMKPSIFVVQTNSQLREREAFLAKVSKACIAISVILFIVAAATSDLAYAAISAACQERLCLNDVDIAKARNVVVWSIVRLVFNFLGKSLISTVFFADGVVTLMFYFHYSEMNDSISVQCQRAGLVDDLTSMFPSASKLKASDDEDGHGTADAGAATSEPTTYKAVVPMRAIAEAQALIQRMRDGSSADAGTSSDDVRRAAGELASLLGAAAVPVTQRAAAAASAAAASAAGAPESRADASRAVASAHAAFSRFAGAATSTVAAATAAARKGPSE